MTANLEESTEMNTSINRMIPRSSLTRWVEQPRTEFTAEDQDRLRQSMKTHGFDEAYPLLCRPVEYQAVPAVADGEPVPEKFKFRIEYRGHSTAKWKDVRDDIVFPVGPSWTALETQEDVELAYAWLPKFQIVDGERRFREATELNIHELPCVIREISDKEALEKALCAGLQQKRLNALEQAEGFYRLAAEGATPKEIAESIGVSAQHVSDHISLRNLRNTPAGKAIVSGKIGITHGHLLAKLPTPELREDWTGKVLNNPWGESPMSSRQLEDKLRELVMKELRGCGFDTTDATLVPVRHKLPMKDGLIDYDAPPGTGERILGGACTDCPFNTRNISVEEGATKARNHMCLSPECFRMKQVAEHERWCSSAAPYKTLTIEENEALWAPNGKALDFDSSYVELEEKPHDTILKPTVVCTEPWKKLIEGQTVEIIAVRDVVGSTHLIVDRDLAIAAAHQNKHHIFRKEPSATEAGPAKPTGESSGIPAVDAAAAVIKQQQETAEAKAAKEAEDLQNEVVWLAMIQALVDAIGGAKTAPDGFFTLLMEKFGRMFNEGLGIAAERRDVPVDAINKSLVKGNEMSVAALLIEIILHDDWWSNGHQAGEETILQWGRLFGLNLKKVANAAKKTHLAAIAEEAKACASSNGMKWIPRKAPGTEFTVNSGNVVEDPEMCELTFPKAMKLTGGFDVAKVDGEWVWGYFLQSAKWGNSSPCYASASKYGTRELAVKAALLEIRHRLKRESGVPEAAVAIVDGWIASIVEAAPVPEKPKAKKPKAKHPAGKVIAAVKGKGAKK